MIPDLLVAFVGYVVVTSITPGPNNTILMASGANHDFAATVPSGAALHKVLANPRALRVFNGVMALLLVTSLYPILFPA